MSAAASDSCINATGLDLPERRDSARRDVPFASDFAQASLGRWRLPDFSDPWLERAKTCQVQTSPGADINSGRQQPDVPWAGQDRAKTGAQHLAVANGADRVFVEVTGQILGDRGCWTSQARRDREQDQSRRLIPRLNSQFEHL
jgi:hypothetical protein